MLKVEYKKPAIKGARKMPIKLRQRMQKEIEAIATDFESYRGDWKPLSGSNYWRLRIGGYRAICSIQNDIMVLLGIKIGPRGDVYK